MIDIREVFLSNRWDGTERIDGMGKCGDLFDFGLYLMICERREGEGKEKKYGGRIREGQ